MANKHQGNAKFKPHCNTTTLPPEWLRLRRLDDDKW